VCYPALQSGIWGEKRRATEQKVHVRILSGTLLLAHLPEIAPSVERSPLRSHFRAPGAQSQRGPTTIMGRSQCSRSALATLPAPKGRAVESPCDPSTIARASRSFANSLIATQTP
jgi:hypothetical protein